MESSEYEITSDGVTVWINSPEGSIARFGRNGIDIHHVPGEQIKAGSQCLQCTHERTTFQDWEKFKEGVFRYHGIIISDGFMPKRFKEEKDVP